MPLYDYKCEKCAHVFEVQRSMNDPDVTECEKCKGPVKRVFSPIGIAFKGSGFYINDNKGAKSSMAATSGSGDDKTKTETKSESSTPEPAKAEKSEKSENKKSGAQAA